MWRQVSASAIIALFVVAWLFPAPQTKAPEPSAPSPALSAPTNSQKAEPARCRPSDFQVEGFKATVYDDCRRTPCPALKLTGRLKNNCNLPAGAQLKITATPKSGDLVDTVEGWPASIRNISPSDSYAFDLGPLMTHRSNMSSFSVQVIDARTWR